MARAKIGTLFLAAVAFLFAAPGHAQSGKITGVVRDSSGGVMPGVTVTATNLKTGSVQSVTTGGEGTYAISGLSAGTYTVSASLLGFRKVIEKDKAVSEGASISVDFTLVALLAEEITVTAMKREDTVGNVPFSVAAPTEDILRARGADNIEDIAGNVGGFTVQNLGPGQSQVAMRGVSSGQIARDQPGVKEQVGVYLDETPVALSLFTPDMDLFDVSRVEILRGPQGTLFGAGSESGTVRYITNQPILGLTQWFTQFGGSTLKGGDFGGEGKFGGNVPLGTQAALRFVGFYDHLGGYIDAVQPNLSVKKHVNNGDRSGGRVAIKIAPDDKLSIEPRVMYQYVKMNGFNRIDGFNILANPYTTTRPAVTLGSREQFTQFEEPFTDKFLVADLDIRYNFGNAILTSISSYDHREILQVRDATALTASITGGSIGLPANIYTLNAPLNDATTAKAFTEEIRLNGTSGRVQWLIGGFYLHNDRDYGQDLLVSGFSTLSGIPTASVFAPTDVLFYSKLGYKLNEEAAFGEFTWAVDDKFSLTGGLRYYHYNEDKAQVFDGIFGEGSDGLPQSQPGTTTANGVAPRVIASYKVSPSSTLNAQVSKGFRLGGVNDPLNVSLCTAQDLLTFGGHPTWQDETTWNYEIGSKSTLWKGKGSFNIAVFYEDIKNLQATLTAGSCSSRVIFNVPKSRSVGTEVEFEVAPTRNFDLALSGSYHDASLQSTLTNSLTLPPGSPVSLATIPDGDRLPSVPKVEFSVAATYQWQAAQGYQAYITAVDKYVGDRLTQLGDELFGTLNLNSFGANTLGAPLTASTFTYNPLMPSYNLLNARFGVRHDKWDASAYCNNITDEIAFLALDRERGTRARIGYLTNPPRTFGVQVRIDF
jgi:iron complex outermembrane receptor protein